MASYRLLPVPPSLADVGALIKRALISGATSVEVFADDEGDWSIAMWLDKVTNLSGHTKIP